MHKALFLAAMLALAPLGAGPAVAQTQAGQQSMVAWGCSAASTAAVTAAVVINGQTLVNVVSGAMAAPLSPALLYGGLAAIVASSVCALGYQMVPVLVSFGGTPAPAVPTTAAERYAEAAR